MLKPIVLYNTMTRSDQPLTTVDPGIVRIYTCGPTVYGYAHIGNLRTYIAEDILVKTLRYFGYQVERVMNITDVGHLTSDADEGEDKLEIGAKRDNITAWEVAKRYEKAFIEDMESLGLEVPDPLVRATDTIVEQIDFVKKLEEKGFVYRASDGMYFDSSKVPDYGKLARLNLEGQQAGARVALQEGKRHPSDFALWKFSAEPGKRDMEWESPWGIGFPGWHIECSAIALKTLGPELDIHFGGPDHIPVHHTNEIAQSESLTGKPLAHHWMHTEFLLIDNGKMSKSLGNTFTLADLKERGIDPLAFKFFTYSASYHSKLNFTWEAMEAAQASLQKLYGLAAPLLSEISHESEAVKALSGEGERALADDLNLPELVALLWKVLRSDLSASEKKAFVERFEPVLGLDLLVSHEERVEVPQEVIDLVLEREKAREAKDWARSDALREQIESYGFQVVDLQNQDKKSKIVKK